MVCVGFANSVLSPKLLSAELKILPIELATPLLPKNTNLTVNNCGGIKYCPGFPSIAAEAKPGTE